MGEIRAIRDKVLAKLREKKRKSPEQQPTPNNILDEQSLSLANLTNHSITLYDHLELYSREGRVTFEDTLIDSQTPRKPKRGRNNLSLSGKADPNRSLNSSRPDCSLDSKMEFSEYSE